MKKICKDWRTFMKNYKEEKMKNNFGMKTKEANLRIQSLANSSSNFYTFWQKIIFKGIDQIYPEVFNDEFLNKIENYFKNRKKLN